MDLLKWVILIVANAIAGGIVGFVLRERRTRARRDSERDELILEYGKAVKVFAILGMTWFPIIILIALAIKSRGFQDLGEIDEFMGGSWDAFILATLVLAGLLMPLAFEAFGIRHRITHIGLKKHSPWSRDFYASWEEVESVTWRHSIWGYEVKTKLGMLRLPMVLHGLRDFADAVVEKLPEHKWATARDKILRLRSKPGEL